MIDIASESPNSVMIRGSKDGGMIALLFRLSAAVDYDGLLPPLSFTNLSEIGNWTLRGSATNMKTFIRLASNQGHQFGSVCGRLPSRFRDWELRLELSIHSGGRSGNGVRVSFSRLPCPSISDRIDGFCVWIDTQRLVTGGRALLFFMNGTGPRDPRIEAGSMKIRMTDQRRVTFIVSRVADHLTFDLVRDSVQERVGEIQSENLLSYGYFTVIGSSQDGRDIHDLISLRIHYRESPANEPSNIDYSTVNRKLIGLQKAQREAAKRRRRQAMATTFRYVNYSKARLLNGDNTDLREALAILGEAKQRARRDITVIRLASLIRGPIAKTVAAAYKKIKNASHKFDEINEGLAELWTSLRAQLHDLAVETHTQMAEVQADVITAVIDANLTQIDAATVKTGLKRRAQNVSDSWMTIGLATTGCIEVIGFIIFFDIRRKATAGFKKND
jgi:mannose-binding lectin 1